MAILTPNEMMTRVTGKEFNKEHSPLFSKTLGDLLLPEVKLAQAEPGLWEIPEGYAIEQHPEAPQLGGQLIEAETSFRRFYLGTDKRVEARGKNPGYVLAFKTTLPLLQQGYYDTLFAQEFMGFPSGLPVVFRHYRDISAFISREDATTMEDQAAVRAIKEMLGEMPKQPRDPSMNERSLRYKTVEQYLTGAALAGLLCSPDQFLRSYSNMELDPTRLNSEKEMDAWREMVIKVGRSGLEIRSREDDYEFFSEGKDKSNPYLRESHFTDGKESMRITKYPARFVAGGKTLGWLLLSVGEFYSSKTLDRFCDYRDTLGDMKDYERTVGIRP